MAATPPATFEAKIVAPAEALARIGALPRPLVFTNGVFDILHRGHVTYLDAARQLGAALVVAVNSDASVRRLGKGGDRPHNPLEDRMAVLAALSAVDLVVPFDDDTPRALVVACRPDVLVKGGDYTEATVVGAPFVRSYGGTVTLVPLLPGTSTTRMVSRMKGEAR